MLFRPKLLCNPFTGFRRQWHGNQTITRSPATHREVLHCGLWIGRTQVWKTPRCLPASWSWRPVPHPHPYYPRGGHISLQISNWFFHIWITFDIKYVDGHYSILVFVSTTWLGGAQVHRDHKGCHGLETLEYSAAKRQTEEWRQLLQCRFGQRKSRHPTGWFDVKTPKYIWR